ncbi:hypothetical protein EVAR_6829_1 [Eumeta japonica]|uniref:Uncharacterized protein n=1 Tax=Eumeta variegata TaxID=151549 RepID=A0A4C1U700_EUMVA|nr:hypothetical protein EVAR_6829_1 [Eumeta japonica]
MFSRGRGNGARRYPAANSRNETIGVARFGQPYEVIEKFTICFLADSFRFTVIQYLQYRESRVVGDYAASDQLDPLALRRDVVSLGMPCRIHCEECFEEL